MSKAGVGHRFHITGLTHDERGYPAATWQGQAQLVTRLVDKIRKNELGVGRTISTSPPGKTPRPKAWAICMRRACEESSCSARAVASEWSGSYVE